MSEDEIQELKSLRVLAKAAGKFVEHLAAASVDTPLNLGVSDASTLAYIELGRLIGYCQDAGTIDMSKMKFNTANSNKIRFENARSTET